VNANKTPGTPAISGRKATMRTSGIQGTPATTEMPATMARQAKALTRAVLRIRDVYPGSEFFPFRIPERNFFIPDPGSKRFPDPHPHQRNLIILTQKMVSKLSESGET
jgi:hypothetical protein